jgi:Ca-activated chloride channel family protein
MQFYYPFLLWLWLLIPLLLVVFWFSERRRKHWLRFFSAISHGPQVMALPTQWRWLKLMLLLLGLFFLVFALARPQWGKQLETISRRGIDLFVAVDVSESMRAQDVSPSRMDKAKQEVFHFLDQLKGDRVGLIAFAGSAFTYCPLTVDYAAVRMFLSSLEPGVIADGGTDLSAAIAEARLRFQQSQGTADRALVVFSDGEHHENDPLPEARLAADEGIQIFSIGIGHVGKAGARIPLEQGNDAAEDHYTRDRQGRLVITRLDEATLQSIADAGGGSYHRVTSEGSELVRIYQSLARLEKAEQQAKLHERREDHYRLFLGLSFFFLTLSYGIGNHAMGRLRRTQSRGDSMGIRRSLW